MLRVDEYQLRELALQNIPQRSPVAMSVTWQFFSHPRSCIKSRVNVGKFRLFTSRCGWPTGGSTHTVTLFLWTSMPQQRRWFDFTTGSLRSPGEGRLG